MENIIRNIRITFLANPVIARWIWTIFFILVYLIGQEIPIFTVPLNTQLFTDIDTKNLLETLAVFSGGKLSSLTLFSLGIGPWMTSMILWRFFAVFGFLKNKTSLQNYRYQMLLTIAIACLQSYALTGNADFSQVVFFGGTNPEMVRHLTVLILVTGSLVLIWLGTQNGQKGLGGTMIFILTNMILTFVTTLFRYFNDNTFDRDELIVGVAIFAAIILTLTLVAVTLQALEYRIPIRRISLPHSYLKESYLPLRLMPAGSMPFMYGISMMMLPMYIVSMLLRKDPTNETLLFLYQNVGISKLLGAIIYCIVLYILAIGFAYYNYDSFEIAKGMRQNGDYIDSVVPGYETQRFLSRKIGVVAQIGAVITVLLGGLPMLLVVQSQEKVSPALLVSNVFVIVSLVLGVVQQVSALQMWKKYKDIL